MNSLQKEYVIWLFKLLGVGFTAPFSINISNWITNDHFPGLISLGISFLILLIGVTILYIAFEALKRF